MTSMTLNLYRRSTRFTHSKKKAKYSLTECIKNDEVKWTTDLNFSASELDFTLVYPNKSIIPYTGDIISFRWNKHKVFYGYVFSYQVKADNSVSVKCFAPSRYLKNEDAIVFKSGTIADRFTNVCKRAGIKYKVVKRPSHKVKAEICENKTYFSMVKSAIDKTYKSTGHRYFVLDNYDTVELRRVPYKKLKIYVGSKSGMTDFSYAVDINSTANAIRVVHKNSKKSQTISSTAKAKGRTKGRVRGRVKGRTKVRVRASSKETPENTSFSYTDAKGQSIAQWGKLQKTVNAKSKANHAQLVAQAKAELKARNVANKTLTITCIGNLDFVAGNAVTIKITDLKKKISNCPIIKAVHTFGSNYKCELVMKAGQSWQENGSSSS